MAAHITAPAHASLDQPSATSLGVRAGYRCEIDAERLRQASLRWQARAFMMLFVLGGLTGIMLAICAMPNTALTLASCPIVKK
jgi:hypothetical protein